MMKLWAICYYTFRESLARKTFVAFFVVSSLLLTIFLFALNIDAVDGALASLSIFGQTAEDLDVDINLFVSRVESGIAVALYTVGLFFSVFATASLIPNMLEKGNIDWLLAKPISREQLLFGRFLGALGIVGFNVFYLIGGSWLILSLKTGVWHFPFLQAGLLILCVFAVMYAFMAFLGVTWQNSAICIMGVFLFSILGVEALQSDIVYALLSSKTAHVIVDTIYYITPKPIDVGQITIFKVLEQPISSWAPLWHSLIVGAVYFASAVIIFKRKNF